MGINFRLCPNDTTKWLQQTFQATPLKVPEARIQPLLVIAKQDDGKISVRGELKYLFKDDTSLDFQLRKDTVANASLDRTKSVDIDFGFKVLEGFLQGLKLSSSVVGAAFKGVNEISFSFTDVKRHWMDINHLGATIKNKVLDLDHPSLGIFKGEDAVDMLLISDAIVSNSFTINHESGRDDAFEAGVPAIKKYIADLDVKVKVKSNTKKSITFEGDEYLTFAFSCVRLSFDVKTGAIAIGGSVDTKGLEATQGPVQHALIDGDTHRAAVLSWD